MDTLSPLDNRYSILVLPLNKYFSYRSWIKYRVKIELIYFKFLCETLELTISEDKLISFMKHDINVLRVLDIEKTIHHDIKSIELYLKEVYIELNIGPKKYIEYIHFGLTSQDINSVAFSLQLKDAITEVIIPKLDAFIKLLSQKASLWDNLIILAYTHGQPAIPSTLGKEMRVFIERVTHCLDKLKGHTYYTKIGGAVGTLAAHYYVFPDISWNEHLKALCAELGLKRWQYTTQITNYEDITELSQILIRINAILIDFSQDIWIYISMNYFILEKETPNQVGSSTMPQKVNPIDFENAEANLKLANSGLEFMVNKLPISRLQRDLTDSSTLRNYGVNIAHSLIAIENIMKGVKKIKPNYPEITARLEQHPEILAEGIQCLLRVNGIENPYDIIRKATQEKKYSSLTEFKESIIDLLDLDDNKLKLKKKIMKLNYSNYLGTF
jgi:adenylosuccinate lyase